MTAVKARKLSDEREKYMKETGEWVAEKVRELDAKIEKTAKNTDFRYTDVVTFDKTISTLNEGEVTRLDKLAEHYREKGFSTELSNSSYSHVVVTKGGEDQATIQVHCVRFSVAW
jgi:hypothetical protein